MRTLIGPLQSAPVCTFALAFPLPSFMRFSLISLGTISPCQVSPLRFQQFCRKGRCSAIRVSAAWGVDRGRGQVPRLFPVRRTKGGAGGGSRTLKGRSPADFRTCYGFRRPDRARGLECGLGSGLSLRHAQERFRGLGAARLVSTPSRPDALVRAELGSGLPFHRLPRV